MDTHDGTHVVQEANDDGDDVKKQDKQTFSQNAREEEKALY